MLREYRPYLRDMLSSAERSLEYTAGYSFADFLADRKTYDAVLRNLTIIGEAAKQIPAEVRQRWPDVDWRNMGRFRDIAVHHYFGIDDEAVWSILEADLPVLLRQLPPIIAAEAARVDDSAH